MTHKKAVPFIPSIKIIGLGGGGSNAIDRILDFGLQDVEFVAGNTDKQALGRSKSPKKLQLGPRLTRGLGAGGRPEIGRKSAEESYHEIKQSLEETDIVFLTAGMGGGTGTGAIPVVAKISKSLDILTIAVVTLPFSFEGGVRQKNAREGLRQLQPHVDTLITIPNERLLKALPQKTTFLEAFHLADDVLRQAVQSIVELITEPGTINVDFANIKRFIKVGGGALMSIGHGSGKHKAIHAVKQALYHPLLDNISICDAAGIIINFTAGPDLTLLEMGEALGFLQEQTADNVELVFGTTNKAGLKGQVQANLVITGLGATTLEEVFSSIGAGNTSPQRKRPTPTKIPSKQHAFRATPSPQMAGNTSNLDVPTFMRSRTCSTFRT